MSEMNEFMKKERTGEDSNDGFDFLLNDLKWQDYVFNREPFQVCKWNFIKIDEDHRLYWHIYDNLTFFCGLKWVSNECDKPQWGPETGIQVLFVSVGFFDGIRHTYIGEPNGGYIFCINPDALGRLLIEMDKIWISIYEKEN